MNKISFSEILKKTNLEEFSELEYQTLKITLVTWPEYKDIIIKDNSLNCILIIDSNNESCLEMSISNSDKLDTADLQDIVDLFLRRVKDFIQDA